MNTDKKPLRDSESTILYGVPKAHYGAYGGCTPYPICLKSCASYLRLNIDYADAITGCGAAFRLTWNTQDWDGGNVDVWHTFDESADSARIYANGITALGRTYQLLRRQPVTGKDEVRLFIKNALDAGSPVIAMGMVGPPEAGIVCGYRDNGRIMLGWSVFQDFPDYKATVQIDESGYYITDRWWENGVEALITMGEHAGDRIAPEDVARRAVEVLSPRQFGPHAKGLLAYTAWRKAISDDHEFMFADEPGEVLSPANELRPEGSQQVRLSKLAWRLMCQGDAADCLADGRNQAARYFARLADRHPLYGEIAANWQTVAQAAMQMYQTLGGWERGEKQAEALAKPDIRQRLCTLIDQAETADTAALKNLVKLTGI